MFAALVLLAVVPATLATASPTLRPRVVLADDDPELRRAIEASLQPWRIEIIVDPSPPASPAAAHARADGREARYVVWRDGDQLVVYDRETDRAERRTARAGAFDPTAAAAAALSIKTMMRLPPPPVESDGLPAPGLGSAVAPPPTGLEVRIDAMAGAGVTSGLETSFAPRYSLGAFVRPSAGSGLRFGVVGDLATNAGVDHGSFHGGFSQWAILAAASFAFERGPWELAPSLAAGVEHVGYDGSDPQGSQSESATVLTLRGGGSARLRSGRWTIGLGLGFEVVPSTRTYTKIGSMAEIFEIPRLGVTLGLVAGVDVVP